MRTRSQHRKEAALTKNPPRVEENDLVKGGESLSSKLFPSLVLFVQILKYVSFLFYNRNFWTADGRRRKEESLKAPEYCQRRFICAEGIQPCCLQRWRQEDGSRSGFPLEKMISFDWFSKFVSRIPKHFGQQRFSAERPRHQLEGIEWHQFGCFSFTRITSFPSWNR